MVAVVRKLAPGSESAIYYIVPCCVAVSALAIYWLGAALHSRRAGLWAGLLFLLSAATVEIGTRALSDLPALTFILLGFVALIADGRMPAWGRGILAGFCFGFACWVRQVSMLAMGGVALWAISGGRQSWRSWPKWVALGLTFGAMVAALLWYQASYFGGPLATGYAPEHHWIPFPPFTWQNFLGRSPIWPGGYRSTLQTLWEDLGAPGLALAALGCIFVRRRAGASLGVTAALFLVLYSFYAWPTSGVGSRFLLPGLAVAWLFAGAGLDRLLSALFRHRTASLAVGFAVVTALGVPSAVPAFRSAAQRSSEMAERIAFAKVISAKTDLDAVFISLRYGDHIVLYGERAVLLHTLIPSPERGRYREEEFEPGLNAAVGKLLEMGIPVYVVDDGASGSRAGLFDPVPALAKRYTLVPCPDTSPLVLRVWVQPPDEPTSGCWKAG
jgi:4-amino-4-deoxy-L-arabinose transferase-like glycosyltransferase